MVFPVPGCVRGLMFQYLDVEQLIQLRSISSTYAECMEVLLKQGLPQRIATGQAAQGAQGMYGQADVALSIRSYAIAAASGHVADKEHEVRGQALNSLSVLSRKGDQVVVGRLCKAAEKGPSEAVRTDALSALSQFAAEDDPAVSVVVATCLEDDSSKIRAAATAIFCEYAIRAPELFIQDFASSRRCSTFPVPSSVSKMLCRVAQTGGERVVAVMHEALGPGYMNQVKMSKRGKQSKRRDR